jgi:hypothetical protein
MEEASVRTLQVLANQVFVIITLLVVSTASAHALSGQLGAQLAVVGNELTGELPNEGQWKGSSALGYGLVAELNLAPDITLSVQPGFSPRHCRQEFKVNGQVIGSIDYEVDYFSLPLLVRVTGDPLGVRGFVTAGLEYSVLLDASLDLGEGQEDITDSFQSTTMGALFGAGVLVPLGRNFLTFELRYNQGLNDILERHESEPEPGLGSPSVKYRGFNLIAGFLFSLGGE